MRRTRCLGAVAAALVLLGAACSSGASDRDASARDNPSVTTAPTSSTSSASGPTDSGNPRALILRTLDTLAIKGRAPRTGYDRREFGPAWSDVDHNGCDTRNDILNRDLTDRAWRPGTHGCVVVAGRLTDPYTGKAILFEKAHAIAVQVDHVVALSDAWQKGAQSWAPAQRLAFANDPLNLLAVDGPTNESKGDGDAATWLPPRKAFRCAYVARQVDTKAKYGLWVTRAEHDAIVRVADRC